VRRQVVVSETCVAMATQLIDQHLPVEVVAALAGLDSMISRVTPRSSNGLTIRRKHSARISVSRPVP